MIVTWFTEFDSTDIAWSVVYCTCVASTWLPCFLLLFFLTDAVWDLILSRHQSFQSLPTQGIQGTLMTTLRRTGELLLPSQESYWNHLKIFNHEGVNCFRLPGELMLSTLFSMFCAVGIFSAWWSNQYNKHNIFYSLTQTYLLWTIKGKSQISGLSLRTGGWRFPPRILRYTCIPGYFDLKPAMMLTSLLQLESLAIFCISPLTCTSRIIDSPARFPSRNHTCDRNFTSSNAQPLTLDH